MQDFDSGTTFTISLTKPVTQLVSRTTAAGAKTWNIPKCEASTNGYSLDLKTTAGDSSAQNIVPAGGKIGGLGGITFNDTNCNLSLRCKGVDEDWIIRCLCCYTPTEFVPMGGGSPPPPVWAVGITAGGGPNGLAAGNGGAVGVVGLGSNRLTASGNGDNGLTTTGPTLVTVSIALTQTSQINQLGAQPPSPVVTSVTSPNLTFTQKSAQSWALDAMFFPPGYTRIELWSAIASGPLTNEMILAEFDGYVLNAEIGVIAFYDAVLASPWDSNGALPATAYNQSQTVPALDTVSGVSTTSSNTVLLAPTSSNSAASWPGNGIKYSGNPYVGMLIAGTDPPFSDYLSGMVIFLCSAPTPLSGATAPLPATTSGGSPLSVSSFFNNNVSGDAAVTSWATLLHAVRLNHPAPSTLLIPVQ
jgi:hypothetical protein